MTLQNLYDHIGRQLRICPRKGDDIVYVEIAGSSFGGTPVEPVSSVGCGIDWNDGKFIICTEKELERPEDA
jgi:hypothetical protein